MDFTPNADDRLVSLQVERIDELLGDTDFPTTTDEVVAEFGDVVVEYAGGGSESLEGILRTAGDEEYATTDDLQLAVLNGVDRDAVGRPHYSDRDPPVSGVDRGPDQSF
ncbi:hypothetical protein NGM10_11880 [Halorussus salilacus]|uniref:DUF5789 family protein n=1 Tax=Halorussus salilacus TaxID=2953750 RepID=UPI0020A03619|nr:hypothetical protein [Halorussus salilacus]USZ67424.1 hypothetical protein NGM10_11880 [Halorussus salilacus]